MTNFEWYKEMLESNGIPIDTLNEDVCPVGLRFRFGSCDIDCQECRNWWKEEHIDAKAEKINTKKELLETAIKTVCRDRQDQYGSAEDNFKCIAELWTTYLHGTTITPVDVANMMILLKVARNSTGSGKADNWVDIAGYAACGCELENNK